MSFSFADLADGTWTLEVEMLGFAKLTREVGVAHDAPAPELSVEDSIRGGAGGRPGAFAASGRAGAPAVAPRLRPPGSAGAGACGSNGREDFSG